MFARQTILAAGLLGGLATCLMPAAVRAQSTTMPAKPAMPSNGTRPATNPGASTHGNAMPGSQGIQFKSEAEAKQHCPSGTIVRANLRSKAYHLSGDSYYGRTTAAHSAFMCQTDADANGFHKAGSRHAATASKKPS